MLPRSRTCSSEADDQLGPQRRIALARVERLPGGRAGALVSVAYDEAVVPVAVDVLQHAGQVETHPAAVDRLRERRIAARPRTSAPRHGLIPRGAEPVRGERASPGR